MNTHYEILILGGGTAGLTVASQLADRIGGRHLAIVEPRRPTTTSRCGHSSAAASSRAKIPRARRADLIPDEVTWIRDAATSVDPENRSVVTSASGTLTYDFLVVAPGVVLQWTTIPGLAESSASRVQGSRATTHTRRSRSTWEAIRSFRGGTALFTEPITPVKCGGAPQKIMYLAEEAFRVNGVREKSRVVFMNAKPTLFTAPYYIPALERVIKSRGMEVQLGQELVALRPDAHEAVFRDIKTGNEQVMRYDMIHVTPPMSPPEFVRTGPLANADGWIEVDKFSLQHVRYPEVFGLGDASNLPTSKTGAAIRKQAPVVVENLLALRAGQPLTARYDGYTSCPVVTGRGKLIMAEFNYAKEPVETFPVDQRAERFSMYALKAYMLPRLYWHGMLRGRA